MRSRSSSGASAAARRRPGRAFAANPQCPVALYQEGDVDYLVATDAIGMGLNLDVDHVAFAQDRKFDGYQYRNLNPAELAQVAGRAGRHVRDGTFGVTGRVDPFDEELVHRIESHEFDPVRVLQWRSKALELFFAEGTEKELEAAPAVSGLARALPAVDQQALEHLTRYPEIVDVATASSASRSSGKPARSRIIAASRRLSMRI